MDFIGDLLNQMSSAFNQETAIPKKEEISMDETLKWRALKNNQFASRTRLSQHQQQQQQQQTGSGGGSGTRSGLTNGRRSASGGGSTPGGSNRQRRGTSAGNSRDSASGFSANDEGSRSPAALLGDNGSLTPEVDPDDQDIEIEIAKDISGEELQEALGLSQLVEVEAEADTGSQLEAAAIEHAEEQLEQKSSPTMEADRERVAVNVEETIGAGDCKPEDELDTKSSLEVPYSSSSASVSPAVLTEGKAPNVEQVLLLPTKRDTDEAEPIATGEEKSTDDTDRVATDEEAVSAKSIKTPPVDVPEETATEEADQQREDAGVVTTAPVEDDDEEDDILIISTNSVDEVVELAETSKEDEDDEEMDEPVQTLPEATIDSSQNESETRKDRAEKEPVAVETVPAGNDVDDREEKFHPKQTEDHEEKEKVQTEKVDNTGASPVDGDAEEVKFSETLKPSASAKAIQIHHSRSSSVEKVEDKKETAEAEPKGNVETAIDTDAMNESKDSSAENKSQPSSSGRTTRSRKVTSGSSAIVASPAAGVAAVTHLQRRSQRFQKESSVAPAETAGEPTIVVKEEEPEDGAGASKKRASVGVGVAPGEVRPKSTLKSDRSLRSKQPNQPTVTTRRASETVKASQDEDQEGQDKTIADRRRGRKRLSQDRSQSSSVASNDAVVRTRDKIVREEQPAAGDEPRRESRSGFPLDPGESDTGGRKQEAAEQPQQRRGRKRKNPSDGSPSAATAAASTTTVTTGTTATTSASSASTNADKAPLHPYKRAARMSRDGSDGILASALARRDKVDSQGRLSRPIKLSAKILANEELRQGFEQHNNGRIIIGSEQPAAAAVVVTAQEDDPTPVQREVEPEGRRKVVSVASCTTIGSSSEDVTLVSVTLPTPKPASSTSKTGDRERDLLQLGRQPIESTSNERTAGPRVPATKRTSKATGTGTCPDVQTFLKEVRLMRLGTTRSPEDNPKLNRRQQKRLAKLKEKHFMGLGLQRRGTHQPHRNGGPADENDYDAELSVGESESSGSEADFVPTKKIGTVGKPSVTLRLRKPETLLENPPRRGSGPNAAASRVPLVTVPSGAVNMSSRGTGNAAASRQSQAAAARQAAGKQANGRTMPVTNGPGTSRRSVPVVVLPAVSTTVGARTSSLAVTGEPTGIGATTLGKKETEHLQRSLARLGCEVTVVPSTGGRTVPPVVENATTSSRPPPTPWTVQRAAEVTTSRARPNVPILPGTTSPSLQVTLGNRPISGPAPPVRGSTGKTTGSRTTPPTTTTSSPATGEPTLVCLCRQESEIFVSRTVGNGYCTAVDDIDGQQIGCCNELSSDMVNMLRPSPAVSFQLLCNLHRKRLEDHSCCAVCGWFCTQGQFAMCKNVHLFHPNCADKYTLNTPYNPARPTERVAPTLVLKCPHCNQECPNGEIEVNVQLTSAPVLLPSRKSIVKPAMMTVSKGNTANGDGGAGGDGFRTTVESLVPSSVKNLLSTDHSRTNGGALNASTSAGSSAGAGRSSTASAKDMGGGAAVGKKNFTAKDFSQACTKNDDARVSEIITAGFDIETRFREFHHGTCLHVVCSSGTLAMAYLIMCRARSVNYLNIVDRELHTALMCAVLNSKSDIVKLLLDSGADATLKGPYGMTVLHLAARSGQHATVRTILECARQRLTARDLMAFVDAIDNGHWTALAWAAENRHKQTVEQLIEIGADVNVCDRSNNTALHWASLSGCSDTLYLLLTKNCNTNMQNTNGETPLHIACRQGHAEICVVLLAMGASLNIRNTANELPQDIIEDPNSECANIIAANLKMRNLAKNMKETHIISSDISNGKERHPVQVVYYTRGANDRQLTMPKFKYVQHNVQLDSCITIDPQARTMPICSCTDSCTSADSKCLCSARTWYTNDGRLVSDFNYLDPPTIVECGELCDCNRRLCRNRVVQHGLDVPLQLCYIPGKAWGVRTMVPIPKGSFLVEYVGELVTDEAANHRSDDSYLFDLGNGFCIDANTYGNVSRFFNHSCQPNVTPVSVYYDHADQRFPRVALFACRDIGAQEEICFDYGEKFWMVKKRVLVCRCSTSQCRYREIE